MLKSALDTSPGVLAVIVSGWFFDEVVRHYPAAAPGVYRPAQVTVKETETVAWIRVANHGDTDTAQPPLNAPVRPTEQKPACAEVDRAAPFTNGPTA